MQLSILDLIKPINSLDKISDKTTEKLHQIGIFQAIDLLFYFPINVNYRHFCKNADDFILKSQCVITLKVVKYFKSPKTTKVQCLDTAGNIIYILFFKVYKNFLQNNFPENGIITIVGIVESYKNEFTFTHPQQIIQGENIQTIKPVEVVYRRHQDITSNAFANYINQVLTILENCEISEWLDANFLQKYKLASFKESLKNIHQPANIDAINPTNNFYLRIALDEMIAYHIRLLQARETQIQPSGLAFKINNKLIKPFLKNLPFKLTSEQIHAIKEIKLNLQNNIQTTSLLQGDVGSGKTVVCFILALFAIESGYQVAFMAPTDILAKQHYNNFKEYAQNLQIKLSFLKGKTTKAHKEKIATDLLSGETKIVIGTHAIFQDNISFKKLGLIIIDEQHRFGVAQRLKLFNKSKNAHTILTTATPIPRTLALALYGDIHAFEIKAKPANRKEIITTTLALNKLNYLITSLIQVLAKNKKVFWVCPLVEESDKLDIMSAVARFNYLKEYFKDKVSLIHGKMLSKEKEDTLNQFKNNKNGSILVSTTVIEVGVDITDCNIMIIENAERFGLAQLHQLRGRVGRAELQAHCILLYSHQITKTGKLRLQTMKASNDGFYIAEKDLSLRGAGDLLGISQSGLDIFKVFNFHEHANFTLPAMQHAKYLFHQTGKTDKYAIQQMLKIFNPNQENYIKHG